MADLINHKRARFDFEILDTLEAGIGLLGFEVKSLKTRHGSLLGAHAIIRGGEAYIVGMNIPPYQPKNTPSDYQPDRTRKLLLSKKEIATLGGWERKKGFTIIPTRMYAKNNIIKIELAIARGKKKYDKREVIKRRDTERSIRQEI